jgi:hypothetical protein
MSDGNTGQRQTYMKTNEIRAPSIEQFCAEIFLRTEKKSRSISESSRNVALQNSRSSENRGNAIARLRETLASHFPRSSEIECDAEENV